MLNNSDFYGNASFLVLAIPVLVGTENLDDILERILYIRKQPKNIQPELASDLVADIVKKSTRSLMENMNKVPVNGISEVSDVRE
jgi:hypothetical protein